MDIMPKDTRPKVINTIKETFSGIKVFELVNAEMSRTDTFANIFFVLIFMLANFSGQKNMCAKISTTYNGSNM